MPQQSSILITKNQNILNADHSKNKNNITHRQQSKKENCKHQQQSQKNTIYNHTTGKKTYLPENNRKERKPNDRQQHRQPKTN